MKGAALTVCPGVTLVDLTHDIAPQDVLGGALELAAAWRYFPAGTVFVAIVDPGVGSGRRGIAAEAGGCFFVAPDNGILTLVFREAPPSRVVEVTDARYARPVISRTFEGRDRFAPAAAWLARGVELQALGPEVRDYRLLDIPTPHVTEHAVAGLVLRVDRFGNLVTNIEDATVDRFAGGRAVRVSAGSQAVGTPIGTYAEARDGAVCALFGSSGHLEIAVNGGNAAERLGLSRGAPVVVTRA
jgi:S-adenosylmethionine hydrolase